MLTHGDFRRLLPPGLLALGLLLGPGSGIAPAMPGQPSTRAFPRPVYQGSDREIPRVLRQQISTGIGSVRPANGASSDADSGADSGEEVPDSSTTPDNLHSGEGSGGQGVEDDSSGAGSGLFGTEVATDSGDEADGDDPGDEEATPTAPTVQTTDVVPDELKVPYGWLVLGPRDPAFDRFSEDFGSRPYEEVKKDLQERFPQGEPLQPDDPWLHVLTIDGRDYEFYDRGSRYGREKEWVWWKPGVGWVSLLEEQPPGFSSSVLASYQASREKILPPVIARETTYPVGRDGKGGGTAVSQNLFGGGAVYGDGTRLMRGGYDVHADGTRVFYDGMFWDSNHQTWRYFGMRGMTPDGRRWRADLGWYEKDEDGSVRTHFVTGGNQGVEWVEGTDDLADGDDPPPAPTHTTPTASLPDGKGDKAAG